MGSGIGLEVAAFGIDVRVVAVDPSGIKRVAMSKSDETGSTISAIRRRSSFLWLLLPTIADIS